MTNTDKMESFSSDKSFRISSFGGKVEDLQIWFTILIAYARVYRLNLDLMDVEK